MKIRGTRITAREMYVTYIKNNKDSILTYKKFRAVFREIYKEAVTECLNGEEFNFCAGVGTLSVVKPLKKFRIDESGNIRNLYVNYDETRKLRKQGDEDSVVYFTESFYYKWHYRKALTGGIPHKSLWSFVPTDGPTGIKRRIAKHLRENPRAHLNFKDLTNGG
jgi:hypothetical protein